MATLVRVSDEEPAVHVARFVAETAWSEGGAEVSEPAVAQQVAEAERLLASECYLQLAELLLTSADIVLSKAPEKDAECVFAVISNLVTLTESEEEAIAIAEKVTAKLIAHPEEKGALKFRLLLSLHNQLTPPPAKFRLFLEALQFASAAELSEQAVPVVKKVEAQIRVWGLGLKDQRALYRQVTELLKDVKGSSKESYAYLVKFLGTFKHEDPREMGAVQVEAVRAAVEFMKSPDAFQSDLLELPPLQFLQTSPAHAPLYHLLHIFLRGSVSEYMEFEAKNGSLLEAHGLVAEECRSKLRLMAVAALASKAKASQSLEIRYEDLAAALQVGVEEVEVWVVKAIGAKVVEARMDQLREVVIIT